jgi:3-isopropylmalate dehydrogenase
LRPARVYPQLQEICPLKSELISGGVDLLIIRELLGGIYFGRKENLTENGRRVALDECRYDEDTIARIARLGFEIAGKRRKKLTSVDKANILHTSKLWRTVVQEVSRDFPDIQLENMLVDNCAMQIIKNPGNFDVVLTDNMFGDILSDAAAVLPGSLGLTPSASLNAEGFGLYEPSGGSAPDIAGKGVANPIAQILSAAMMLQYSFNLHSEAACIERAAEAVLAAGIRTPDIQKPGVKAVKTKELGAAVVEFIKAEPS